VLLAVLALITIPLHWWGLDRPWHPAEPPSPPEPAPTEGGAPPSGRPTYLSSVARSAPFLLLTAANALTSLAVFAVVVNLVPMLLEQGLTRNLAAIALGLGGVGQVIGRLGYARFEAATTVTVRTVSVLVAVALATAALALAPAAATLLIALGMVLGLARGIYTLVQATAVTDRWGPAGYGSLNGLLMAPALVASASAPFVGAALAHLLGSYSAAFLVLAGVAGVAAALAAFASPTGSTPLSPAPGSR
jgi:MFS family permease